MKCIYCNKTDSDVKFDSVEHVMPDFLGGTREMSLSKIVCDSCNNKFSGFETKFKEDSLEGLMTSMIGLKNNRTIRLRDDMAKFRMSATNGDLGFFGDMFPRIEKDRKVYFKPQFHLKNKVNGKYEVILAKALESPNADIRRRMSKYAKEGIKIYATEGYTLEQMVNLLGSVGIKYKEKEQHYLSPAQIDQTQQIEIKWDIKVDKSLLRTPAKITFNYMLFCAAESGFIKQFYSFDEFQDIKFFISEGVLKGKMEEVFKFETNPFYSVYGSTTGSPLIHAISLEANNGYIWGFVTLFGQFSYRIRLGKFPFKFANPENFGCASSIEPFFGEITKMQPSTRKDKLIVSNISGSKFNLFSR